MQSGALNRQLKEETMAEDQTPNESAKQLPYTPEDVISAHEKQKKKFLGQGGIKFTAAEQHVLDHDVFPEKPVEIDN